MSLIVRTESPFNAESPLPELASDWITPEPSFYVRSHGAVPRVTSESYRLQVQGLVERPLSLTLEQLRRDFPWTDRTALLQCAGNRRDGHSREREILDDVPWGAGALGNAAWRGIPLAKILEKAGVGRGARHVWFLGLDACRTKAGVVSFGGSVPIEKAMRPETLVALEMNGAPLTPAHGFPARALVPGYIGARSVKWLAGIALSESPSDNYYQTSAYKIFPPDVDSGNVRWQDSEAIGVYPINSAILSPTVGAKVTGQALRVRGYAHASGSPERDVSRVEVSVNEGASWVSVELLSPQAPFSWRLWEATLEALPGPATLIARAWDTRGEGQPPSLPWNFKGYLYNAWHRVPITVA